MQQHTISDTLVLSDIMNSKIAYNTWRSSYDYPPPSAVSQQSQTPGSNIDFRHEQVNKPPKSSLFENAPVNGETENLPTSENTIELSNPQQTNDSNF